VRLFVSLFRAGVVIVATSYLAPEQLYEHGLQRARFVPFIRLLEERLDTLALDGGRDWRLARLRGRPVYYTPLGAAAERALEDAFATATAGLLVAPVTLTIKGRALVVPRASRTTAWFTFALLCERPLGAVDYLALAERFETVFLAGIRRLSSKERDAAHRFHVLIDTLYEARRLLVASAEVPPRQIYEAGDGSAEFERTVSRLIEMQSESYITQRS
jgi:cell division protein ZapE